jgi:hypothetical protein
MLECCHENIISEKYIIACDTNFRVPHHTQKYRPAYYAEVSSPIERACFPTEANDDCFLICILLVRHSTSSDASIMSSGLADISMMRHRENDHARVGVWKLESGS